MGLKNLPGDNGTNIVLGAVGLAALVGLVADRGSKNSHSHSHKGSCSMCGNRMGSRNTPQRTRAQAKAEALVNNLGSSLYQSRFDARNNFVVPAALRNQLNKGRVAFLQKQWTKVYKAMGATSVTYHKRKQEPESMVYPRGGLKWTDKIATLAAAQKKRLEAMGVGPLDPASRRETPTQTAKLQPLMDMELYALAKVKKNRKSVEKNFKTGSVPKWKRDNLLAFYVAYLYSERAWTAYVLTQAGKTSRKDRLPSSSMGKGDPGVLHGLSVVVGLPAPVPELPPGKYYKVIKPKKWTGKPDQDRQPMLYLFKGNTQLALYSVGGSGSMGSFATGKVGGSLFTETSKMAAPSFSLPAGEPKAGGTCVFAGMAAQEKFGDDFFICRRCYATGANYGYAEAMLTAETRLQWVTYLLSTGGAEAFASSMIAAISSYARHGKFSKRNLQEIGVWSGNSLTYQRTLKQRANITPTQLSETATQLGLPSTVRTTTDWFRYRKTPKGSVAGFFRIHDSGDFTVGPGRMQKDYIDGWGRVAYVLKYVHFWAPTRIWAKRQNVSRLKGADKRWVQAGFKEGMRMAVAGSASRLVRAAHRMASKVGVSIFDAPVDPESVLAQGGEHMLVGEQEAPGERDAELAGAGGSTFTYVPNVGICKLLIAVTSKVGNFSIRPSSLYVKTPNNPAYIPYVTVPVAEYNRKPYGRGSNALTAGSGVTVKFGSANGYGNKAKAEAAGVDGQAYAPVYDNRGSQAYQCPVYMKLIPDPKGKLDKKTGMPEWKEAKDCQKAGCRACWLAQDKPIVYGFH